MTQAMKQGSDHLERTIKEKKLKNGLTLWYREPSSDLLVYAESEYYKQFTPNDKDVIMDIGANIGDMPLKWGLFAKEIHSYEPMPDTFEILKMNVENNDLKNCKLYKTAVGHGNEDIKIWINLDKKGTHSTASTFMKKGRKHSFDVSKIDFTEEILRVRPTVLKIDIEGGEKEILDNAQDSLFEPCHTFFLEIHPNKFKNGDDWMRQTVERLTNIFGKCKNIGEITHFGTVTGSMWMFTRN
jgi:FkbM family methyltransferase